MKKKKVLYNFKFYVLTFNDGDFELQLLSEGEFPDSGLAKCHALSVLYNFGKLDVPVVSMGDWFYFYHPRYRKWYDNLTDERMRRLFPWMVPLEDNSSLGYSSNVAGP